MRLLKGYRNLLINGIDFNLLIQEHILNRTFVANPGPLDDQRSQEQFDLIFAGIVKLKQQIHLQILARHKVQIVHPHILMIPDLPRTGMQFQFFNEHILIGLDVERKQCFFVDRDVVIEEITSDGLSEDFVDDEDVADIEVKFFYCVVVGFQGEKLLSPAYLNCLFYRVCEVQLQGLCTEFVAFYPDGVLLCGSFTLHGQLHGYFGVGKILFLLDVCKELSIALIVFKHQQLRGHLASLHPSDGYREAGSLVEVVGLVDGLYDYFWFLDLAE